MDLDKKCPSSSNDHVAIDSLPMVEHTEPNTRHSSLTTIISMTSDGSLPMPSIPSVEIKYLADDGCKFHYVSTKKQAAAKLISASYLRHRLCVREYFLARLTLASNMMSFLAIFGIVLMVIENELTFTCINNKDTKVTWFIKLIISWSTLILVVLILYYHYVDMTLYTYRNLLEHWYVKLTFRRILVITIEILVCAIHPMPRSYPYIDPQKIIPTTYPMSYISLDVALGLPMFLRLYLFSRSIMIHSPAIRSVRLRSLGYLNHVSMNSYFLIKSFLEEWPIRCLFTFTTAIFLIGSWSLHACDYQTTGEHLSMSDSMWLFVMTATTVGYGDVYPSTYCGRSIAAIISLFCLLLTALLIAMFTQKLYLTREEKYVHTFGLNIQATRNQNSQAANVIKFAIKSWYLKRRNKVATIQYFQTERKLFQSITYLQKIRQQQRNLVDSCVGFTELIHSQRTINGQTEDTVTQIAAMKTEMKNMKEELHCLNHNVHTLQNTLNILLDKLSKITSNIPIV